jgi:hypothetical protein
MNYLISGPIASGKTTILNLYKNKLESLGHKVEVVDHIAFELKDNWSTDIVKNIALLKWYQCKDTDDLLIAIQDERFLRVPLDLFDFRIKTKRTDDWIRFEVYSKRDSKTSEYILKFKEFK